MRIHPSITILALPAFALGLAACGSSTSQSPAAKANAAPAPQQASLVIRHKTMGCHDWALNGGVDKVAQQVSLTPGSTLTIVDQDIMPHAVTQTGGPKIVITDPLIDQKKVATIQFTQPGTYQFATKAGEDYAPAPATKGEDHNLQVTVVVA